MINKGFAISKVISFRFEARGESRRHTVVELKFIIKLKNLAAF